MRPSQPSSCDKRHALGSFGTKHFSVFKSNVIILGGSVGGQKIMNAWGNLILPWGFWGSDSRCEAWQRGPLSLLMGNSRHPVSTVLEAGSLSTDRSHDRISRGTLSLPCTQLLS